MPASVFRTAALAATVTVVEVPVAGDVLILIAGMNRGYGNVSAVAGCGASWSQLLYSSTNPGDSSFSTSSQAIWIGTGANAAGVVTPTLVNKTSAGLTAFVVRGTSGGATATSTIHNGAGTGDWPGPVDNALLGQVVIDGYAGSDTGTTFPASTLPSTGWLSAFVGNEEGFTRVYDAYRIPTEGSPTPHQVVSNTGGSAKKILSQIVIGSAAFIPKLAMPGIRVT